MNEELKVIISAEIRDLKNKVNDAKKSISGIEKESKSTGEAVNKIFAKMGDGIHKAFKTAAKASAAVVTAISGITVAAVKGFAQYEQLKGGVEKLFNSSSKTIMNYANEAYKTSGLTANQYMETVTGFSAGLIASMGGDTAAAAEVANMAINDMADNASVFGTAIGDIQNAYQGFAKQNYTMLDNLKLGYGGTREEMLRLLADAEKLSGIHYDINNLDDVYNAIHVIQQEMKITGNAADEASKTISGSINSAKSAWSNLITGLANDDADIPQLVSNVVETSTQVIKNIVPIVQEVLANIPQAISEISPEAGAAFQTIIDVATPIFETLTEVASAAFDGIITALGFIEEHSVAFTILAAGIGVLVGAIELYNAVQAISEGLQAAKIALNLTEETTLWGVASATMAALAPYIAIVAAIAAVIAVIVICIKHWDEIKEACSKAWETIKAKTLEAVENVKQKFEDMKQAISDKVEEIKTKVKEKFEAIKQAISDKVQAAKDAVHEKFEAIKSAISEKVQAAKDTVSNKFSEMKQSMVDKVQGAKDAVINKFQEIKDKIKEKINGAKDAVKSAIDKMKDLLHFSWKLPHLQVPEVVTSGKFSLKPLQVPHFHLQWHAEGGVFDSPTIFGFNGGLHGLGENGAEAVVPLEKNTEWLDKIAERLNRNSDTPIVLQVDGKVFAETSIKSINDLTKQTGKLGLNIY